MVRTCHFAQREPREFPFATAEHVGHTFDNAKAVRAPSGSRRGDRSPRAASHRISFEHHPNLHHR